MIEVDEDKLIMCPVCDAVNIDKGKKNSCRRCGSSIYHHRSFSTEKSWAYLITAMIAYIPANLYPMLVTSAFGTKDESTILGGIVLLWELESYPVAVIIFFASIMIPVTKFLILGFWQC